MPNQGLKRVVRRLHPPLSTLHTRVLTVLGKPASIPVILGRLFPTVVTFHSSRITGSRLSTKIFRVKLLNVVTHSYSSTGFFLSY